jgi:hypothetical protein
MNRIPSALMIAALAAAGACSRGANKPADSALSTDLSLAAQQRGYQPLDSLSAAERANALNTAPAAATPARTRSASGDVSRSTTTRRTSSGTRSTGSSSGSSSTGGTVAQQPREVTVKHTQRDAAIGAAAGAIIGATTSKN